MIMHEVARRDNLKPEMTCLLKVFFKNMNLSLIKRIIPKEMPTQFCTYLALYFSTRQPVGVP